MHFFRKLFSMRSIFLLLTLSATTVDAWTDCSFDEVVSCAECESCCYQNPCFPLAGDATIAFL